MHEPNSNISEGNKTSNIYINTYWEEELGEMGVQTNFCGSLTNPSPRNMYPPPFALKQWPTTLRIRPKFLSWDKMLVLPLPRPRTPAVVLGTTAEYCWSFPHLVCNRQRNSWLFRNEHLECKVYAGDSTYKLWYHLKIEWIDSCPSTCKGYLSHISSRCEALKIKFKIVNATTVKWMEMKHSPKGQPNWPRGAIGQFKGNRVSD